MSFLNQSTPVVLMKLSIDLQNIEDIEFLKSFNEEKRDEILRTAITIGFKSIQMSEVNMDLITLYS